MGKNNFFVKFAHFYIKNIKAVIETVSEIWDLMLELFGKLLEIIVNLFAIIIRIFFFFIPVRQIIATKKTEYLTLTDEEKEILRPDIKEGYYLKKDVREIKQAIQGAQNA